MQVLYYPHLFIRSADELKAMLLFHDVVKTVSADEVPIEWDAYYPLYEQVWAVAGARIVDFYNVTQDQKALAAHRMTRFLETRPWSKPFARYWIPRNWEEALSRLRTSDKRVLPAQSQTNFMSLYLGKLDLGLADYLIREGWARREGDFELQCPEPVARAYMSFLAGSIDRTPGTEVVTDRPSSAIFASAHGLSSQNDYPDTKYLASFQVPMLFAQRNAIKRLSLRDILAARQSLRPQLTQYYHAVDHYGREIEELAAQGRRVAAWQKYEELNDAVDAALNPLLQDRLLRPLLRVASSVIFFAAGGVIGDLFAGSFAAQFLANQAVADVENRTGRFVAHLRRAQQPLRSLRMVRDNLELKAFFKQIPTMMRRGPESLLPGTRLTGTQGD